MPESLRPLLSIVCPVWNMEGRLQNLQSWLSQISDRIEVVLIYDESSDRTLTELIEIVTNNERNEQIRIESGKFGSPGLARNAGLSVASGEWIFFWDSDDIGFPLTIIEKLKGMEKIRSNEIFCFGYNLVQSDGKIAKWKGWTNSKSTNLSLIALNPGLWRFCFPRFIAISKDFSGVRMGEDQLFLARVGLNTISIHFDDTVAYQYFRNIEGQLTSSPNALIDIDFSISSLLVEQKMNPEQRDFINKLLIRQCITAIKLLGWKSRTKAILILFYLSAQNPKQFTSWIIFIFRMKSNG